MSASEKPTKLGTISFIIAVVVILLWCVYFVLFGAMTEGGATFGTDAESAGYALIFGGGAILTILTILLTLAGIILGILALRKGDPRRGLAIAGLVINFLCFSPYCLFLIFIAIGGISSADFGNFIPSSGP